MASTPQNQAYSPASTTKPSGGSSVSTAESSKKMFRLSAEDNARSLVLAEAAEAVLKSRQDAYSAPENNFKNIAGLWSAYKSVKFTRADVSAMLALVKIGRLMTTPDHQDSWIDLAGYAACGLEAAQADKKDD